MKKVLLILILSCITTLNYAQSDSSKLSSRGMIQYSRGGFFSRGQFSIDGKQITRKDVNARLMNYLPSESEFNEYKKYRDITYYTGGAAIAFLVASLIANNNLNTFKNTPSKVLLGVGIGLIIPEAIFAGKRNRHYSHSFELYNRQFL